jgi:uncharacterized protein (DUF3084 family)
MGQRLDTLSRMIDERFATVDQRFAAMDQHLAARDAQLVRLETKTATVDDQLARLETKTATEFRRLRWGLDIVIALLFGLVTKVILDWAMPSRGTSRTNSFENTAGCCFITLLIAARPPR